LNFLRSTADTTNPIEALDVKDWDAHEAASVLANGGSRPSSSDPPTVTDMPHLLEWYAAYCVAIAETCTHAGTNRLLRLLAVPRQLRPHDRSGAVCLKPII
jgi:hypothetical protein